MKTLTPNIYCTFILAAFFLSAPLSGLGQETSFETLWLLGTDDDSQADFSQENSAQDPPGSASQQDDDYYFAGNYGGAIGVVAEDEPLLNYDRALTGGDPRNRIHFILSEEDASPFNEFRVRMDIFGSDSLPIPFTVRWNDAQVLDVTHEVDPTVYEATFTGEDVQAVAGENVLTIERTAGGGWMQFDYVTAEVTRITKELIQSFDAAPKSVPAGDPVTLSWQVDPGAGVSINNGVGNVDAQTQNGIGSIEVVPEVTTNYTLTVTSGGQTETASVNVIATLLRSFAVDESTVLPDTAATLSWSVAPGSAVSISPEIGDVTDLTVDGAGSVEVVPANSELGSTTTYTLTVSKSGQEEFASVDVTVDLRFVDLWTVGIDNSAVSEFSQENSANDPPGSPTLQDDDYYLAGDYGGDIGFLAEDENPLNFDRALTAGDPRNRIHFTLAPGQADPDNEFRLSIDTIINEVDQFFTVFWNDNEVLSDGTLHGVDQLFTTAFTAGDVNATEGENVLRIEGDIVGGWIGFDYIRAEILANAGNQILNLFTTSQRIIPPGGSTTLSWEVDPEASVSIDQGVGDVTGQTMDGEGSIDVSPAETTNYTLTATKGDVTEQITIQVLVRLLGSFEASEVIIEPGAPTTLSWTVNPNATVSLDQGVGNVDELTVDGVGSLEVTPQERTVYTLTVTEGDQTERASVTIDVDFGFELLWQVGLDNNTNTEFSQENAAQDPPGSPELQDDDYYFAGDYGGVIGVVAEDEDTLNFDRALTSGDPRNRIHFILNEAQANPANLYKVTLDTNGNEGSHPFTVLWNDNMVYSDATTGVNAAFTGIFSAADAGASPGENVMTVERGGEGGWIQFDYISVEWVSNFLELAITESAMDPESGGFSLSWKSELGKVYQIEVSPDLDAWTTLAADYPQGGAPGALTTYIDETFSIDTPAMYYRIVHVPPPALYSEDFESGASGWTTGRLDFGTETSWELGAPTNGPGAAHSGDNVYGTDLDADYAFDTHITLQSPVIDLSDVLAATLTYYSFRDIEPLFEGIFVDWIEINVLDENGQPLVEEPIRKVAGSRTEWHQVRVPLPQEAIGQRIRIEFAFVSDLFNAVDPETVLEFTQAGWFIDDVEVLPE